MAALLRQLPRLKRIPGLGYARSPAPPPPAAPFGLRTISSSGTSSATAYKAPLTRTSPGMYHWRHGKMVRSDAKVVGLMEEGTFRLVVLGIDVFFIAIPWSFMAYKIATSS